MTLAKRMSGPKGDSMARFLACFHGRDNALEIWEELTAVWIVNAKGHVIW